MVNIGVYSVSNFTTTKSAGKNELFIIIHKMARIVESTDSGRKYT